MPEGIGYSFLDFEKQQIAQEFADMMGLPKTPESIQQILVAINSNPALGANTYTGREIAAQMTDPTTQSERAGYASTDFKPAGAEEALAAYKESMKPTPQDAPIDEMADYPTGAGDVAAAKSVNVQKPVAKARPTRAATPANVMIDNRAPNQAQPSVDLPPEAYNEAVGKGTPKPIDGSNQGGQSWYDLLLDAVTGATGGGLAGLSYLFSKKNQQPSYPLKASSTPTAPSPTPTASPAAAPPSSSKLVLPGNAGSSIVMPPSNMIQMPNMDNSLGTMNTMDIAKILRAIR